MKPNVCAARSTATAVLLALALSTAAHAQALVVEFEAEPGFRPAFRGSDEELQVLLEFQIPEKFDLNRDGSSELLVTRGGDGTPHELLVISNARAPEVLWQLDLDAHGYTGTGDRTMRFQGFFDIWPDEGGRAAVFGGEGVLVFRPEIGDEVVFRLDADHRLFAVLDVDGDGLDELIVGSFVGNTFPVLRVWGAE